MMKSIFNSWLTRKNIVLAVIAAVLLLLVLFSSYPFNFRPHQPNGFDSQGSAWKDGLPLSVHRWLKAYHYGYSDQCHVYHKMSGDNIPDEFWRWARLMEYIIALCCIAKNREIKNAVRSSRWSDAYRFSTTDLN